MKTLLVTGATGFVGKAFTEHACRLGFQVKGVVRQASDALRLAPMVTPVVTGDIGPSTDWTVPLQGVNAIVHLAARVHIMREVSLHPIDEFRTVNALGTEQLAMLAAQAGVKRFVFLSTIGVNGDRSVVRPCSEYDEPNPHNAYATSKYEAEKSLGRIAVATGMEMVILRAPLVYGPGNPGNFLRLMNAVAWGVPLPFASVNNKRSLIYIGNLIDALALCVEHPSATGKTFLVSDNEDVSTAELVRRTAAVLGMPTRLVSAPKVLILLAGLLTGKNAAIRRLSESLVVNSSRIRSELGWQPPFAMDDGLRATAAWFLQARRERF